MRETKHLLIGADSSTDTKKNPASKAKFDKFPSRFYTIFDSKFSNLGPFLSITFPQGFQKSKSLDIGLWEVGAKRRLNKVNR